MAYSPGHTGRHHAKSHKWHDPYCEGCLRMTEEEEREAQAKTRQTWEEMEASDARAKRASGINELIKDVKHGEADSN